MSEENSLERKFIRFSSILLLHDLSSALSISLRIIWSASSFYFKFFRAHGYRSHDQGILVASCLFLASKVEENIICIKKLSRAFTSLLFHQDVDNSLIEKEILIMERILLNTIQYDLQISHADGPISEIFSVLRELGQDSPTDSRDLERECERESHFLHLERISLSLFNDAYRDFVCIDFSPQELAVGLFFFASSLFHSVEPVPLPSQLEEGLSPTASVPTSQSIHALTLDEMELILSRLSFNVDGEVVQEICHRMLSLYDDYKKFEHSIRDISASKEKKV